MLQMTTEDLLPGDLVSLLRQRQVPSPAAAPTPAAAAGAAGGNSEGGRDKRAKANFSDGPLATSSGSANGGAVANAAAARKPAITMEVVPCDMVLLSGSAVVNESSLTGESVPQMKDALKVLYDYNVLAHACMVFIFSCGGPEKVLKAVLNEVIKVDNYPIIACCGKPSDSYPSSCSSCLLLTCHYFSCDSSRAMERLLYGP